MTSHIGRKQQNKETIKMLPVTKERLSVHSPAIEKGRHRHSWRRDSAPGVKDKESEPHFLTSCPKHQAPRNERFYSIIKNTP